MNHVWLHVHPDEIDYRVDRVDSISIRLVVLLPEGRAPPRRGRHGLMCTARPPPRFEKKGTAEVARSAKKISIYIRGMFPNWRVDSTFGGGEITSRSLVC